MLVVLLYSVLCLMSTAVRRVEGEMRGGVVGGPTAWGQLDSCRFVLMSLVPIRGCFLSIFLGF